METAVIVAIITGTFSFLGTWLVTRAETKKTQQANDDKERNAAIQKAIEKTELNERLKSIESKLDEHNGYGAKFVELAGQYTEIEKKLVAMSKDIEYLRKGAS